MQKQLLWSYFDIYVIMKVQRSSRPSLTTIPLWESPHFHWIVYNWENSLPTRGSRVNETNRGGGSSSQVATNSQLPTHDLLICLVRQAVRTDQTRGFVARGKPRWWLTHTIQHSFISFSNNVVQQFVLRVAYQSGVSRAAHTHQHRGAQQQELRGMLGQWDSIRIIIIGRRLSVTPSADNQDFCWNNQYISLPSSAG